MCRIWQTHIEDEGIKVINNIIKSLKIVLVFLAVFSVAITTSFRDASARISGNAVTNLSGWEYVVSIQTDVSICSGIILSSTSILTTCKCAIDIEMMTAVGKDVRIMVGSLRTDSKSTGQWRPVNHVAEFVLGVNVKPLQLPSWNMRETEYIVVQALKQARYCEVVGWGRTEVLFPTVYEQPSPVLLKMTLKLLTWDECSKIACRGGYDVPYCASSVLLTGKFCAIPIGPGNSCRGDEGGPLVCDGFVSGLISYIKSCGEYNEPNYYARLDIALTFIRKYANVNFDSRVASNFKMILSSILVVLLCK